MKTANISQFKAHISGLLRMVRDGEEVIILDRDIPVARVVSIQREIPRLVDRPPGGPISFQKPNISVQVDPLQYLAEDRAR